MKAKLFILAFIALIVCITMTDDISWAVTVNVSPNPAIIGQNVLISATASFLSPPIGATGPCYIAIDFGDGSSGHIQSCTVTPCTVSTSHIYTSNGTFTVAAAGTCQLGVDNTALPPSAASTLLFIQCAPLDIKPPAAVLPSAIVGQAYMYQLLVSVPGVQTPVTFDTVSGALPQGLILSSAGLISGIPSTAGNYTFSIRATDSCPGQAQSSERTFTLTVNTPPCPVLSITSPSTLPSRNVGQGYSYQIQTTGGQPPINFSLISGSFPPGLSLSTTGMISGTPTSAGDYTFTVRATDSCPGQAQSTDRTFTLTVNTPVLPPLGVTPIPSPVSVPRGESSARSIGYQFRGAPSLNTTLTSPEGIFIVGNEIIETNPKPLTVGIQNGSGFVSEAVNIPVRIVERAVQRNSNTFVYTRTFSGAEGSLTATVLFTITTEAGADFELKRIELYFSNRRPEITVERNYAELKAFAAIRFVGSGLLQGRWEVDGRLLSTVNQHLTYAKDVVLETPEIPPLPTFDTGSHIVRFLVTSPITAIPLPSIVYFVTPDEAKPIPAKIILIAPAHEDKLDYAPANFRWEPLDGTAVYLIQYYEKLDLKPVFSAYTKEPSYSLPKAVFDNIFSPGKKYYWKVTGFNDENNIKGESEVRTFAFRELADHVQGQIMSVFEESTFSDGLVDELKEKFSLTSSDIFQLRSLNLRVVIFETEDDIFPIIDNLGKDSRLLMVQPNFIFRTLIDPKRRVQYASDIMKIDRIHESLKGSGIMVAVLDTGVEETHEDLTAKVIHTENFVKGEEYVAEIHGTAVAGIIAAGVNGLGIEGIAPASSIIALRSCRQISSEEPQGECYSDSIAKALDKAIERKSHIVNMSFGTARYDNLVSKLMEKGKEEGMLFVAPSGNRPNEKSLRFPASHPSVISVGGFDENMKPYPNAELFKKTSVSAPAVNILTTVPVNKYNFVSGTSMSSACISGVLALALEKDKSITKDKLPVFKGDICAWEEELLKLSLCE